MPTRHAGKRVARFTLGELAELAGLTGLAGQLILVGADGIEPPTAGV